jgi:NAD+ kinase
MIKAISLIVKQGADLPMKMGERLSSALGIRGIAVTNGEVDPTASAVVVLGGDGTLLHVAGKAYLYNLPLMGINMGTLGFLTEIPLEEMDTAMDALIEGRFELDRRTMLHVQASGGSGPAFEDYALNEAVITRGSLGSVIAIPAWANGAFLTTYRGDGLIIATPTGSTAYNLSAGGPILHPGMEAVILTPICPFALNARPLILPADMEVCVEIKKGQGDINLIIDGRASFNFKNGGTVTIRRADGYLNLIRSPLRDYFTILREKLGWAKGVGA